MGAGATTAIVDPAARTAAVSILTRPWRRVQRAGKHSSVSLIGFQSSPARGGRCNVATVPPARRVGVGFNPHPPVGAGATGGSAHLDEDGLVSILTRPWGRVQRGLENARERFPKRKCSSCQGVPCRALGG